MENRRLNSCRRSFNLPLHLSNPISTCLTCPRFKATFQTASCLPYQLCQISAICSSRDPAGQHRLALACSNSTRLLKVALHIIDEYQASQAGFRRCWICRRKPSSLVLHLRHISLPVMVSVAVLQNEQRLLTARLHLLTSICPVSWSIRRSIFTSTS